MELFVRPAGPADAEEIARTQRLSWRATYAELLNADSLDRAEAAWDERHWRRLLERVDDRSVVLVLEDRHVGVVGYGVAGPRRGGRDPALREFEGEIYLLYLLPAFQGQGHGARLIQALARVLLARGMRSALVWALAGNGRAIAFYERLSGARLGGARKPFFGQHLDEVALGWRDLTQLTGMSWRLRD